jgi:hypothetical protein
LLLDEDATRESIMRAFLRYADGTTVNQDDRIIIFFAGHGHTVTGRRGDIGYLIPVDGKVDDLSTLIRWDDLTRNADLVPAKHMLFLMDACYGGLALTRATIPPGSMRFLKDMLQRYSRQVLAAGKADEVVSDGGGARVGHSIFTSYLLDGLEGAAATTDKIITGYGLMAYVYNKVSNDLHSRQTPHFGFFDGDGDLIFDVSTLAQLKSNTSLESELEPDLDLFIKAPELAGLPVQKEETKADVLKRLIATPNEKMRLYDLVTDLLRSAGGQLSPTIFPTSQPITNEEFSARVQRYEESMSDLVLAVILLSRWAEPAQIALLERIFAAVAELEKPQAGLVVWIRLGWYPSLILMYAAGISALAGSRFDTLRAALLTGVYTPRPLLNLDRSPVVLPTIAELTEIVEQFKRLPDMGTKYVPRSEHIYKRLQPVIEDQLFLGRRYDSIFDQFEIILALTFADLRDEDPAVHVWGPPGRFAWKERGRGSGRPVFTDFINQAKAQGNQWPLLKEGFFRRSAERFSSVADAYTKLLAAIPQW